MIEPPLCKTCGACLGPKYEAFIDLIYDVKMDTYIEECPAKIGEMLDKLHIYRLCCRTNILTAKNFAKEYCKIYPRKSAETF